MEIHLCHRALSAQTQSLIENGHGILDEKLTPSDTELLLGCLFIGFDMQVSYEDIRQHVETRDITPLLAADGMDIVFHC